MDWEKDTFFTFGELVKFGLMEKGLSCCFRDQKIKKRKEFYDRVVDSKDTRTDIISIMKSVADIDSMKEALLSPYQQRLIHYLATAKEDNEANEEEMTVKQALADLNKPDKKNTMVQEDFDKYLRANLPAGILSGEFEKLDSENSNHQIDAIGEYEMGNSLSVPQENLHNELLSPNLSKGSMIKRKL